MFLSLFFCWLHVVLITWGDLLSVHLSLWLQSQEYCSSVWSPYTAKHRALVEDVQRRATKFVLKYPPAMSYKERLVALNLLPLECRRTIKDVITLYKFKSGLMPVDSNNFFSLNNSIYLTRNSSPNNLNINLNHNQNYYRSFFFPVQLIYGTVYCTILSNLPL